MTGEEGIQVLNDQTKHPLELVELDKRSVI
jgi:hypothetical protein